MFFTLVSNSQKFQIFWSIKNRRVTFGKYQRMKTILLVLLLITVALGVSGEECRQFGKYQKWPHRKSDLILDTFFKTRHAKGSMEVKPTVVRDFTVIKHSLTGLKECVTIGIQLFPRSLWPTLTNFDTTQNMKIFSKQDDPLRFEHNPPRLTKKSRMNGSFY